jgi:predicted Zn-dependent peptidase
MKSSYVDNALMLYDDARDLNFTFAYEDHIMGLGYGSVEARRSAYENITPEDVMRAAEIIFTSSNLTLTAKGNKKRINAARIESIISELK